LVTKDQWCGVHDRWEEPSFNRGYPNANGTINTGKSRIPKCGSPNEEMRISKGEMRNC
jgi:hypothetical protein